LASSIEQAKGTNDALKSSIEETAASLTQKSRPKVRSG